MDDDLSRYLFEDTGDVGGGNGGVAMEQQEASAGDVGNWDFAASGGSAAAVEEHMLQEEAWEVESDVFCPVPSRDFASCAQQLSSSLVDAGFGAESLPSFQSFGHEHGTPVLRLIHSLLVRLQNGAAVTQQASSLQHVMTHDLRQAKADKVRILEKLKAKDVALGDYERRLVNAEEKHETVKAALSHDLDSARAALVSVQRKDTQALHDSRKMERELNRLKERLAQISVERDQQVALAGIAATEVQKKLVAGRSSGKNREDIVNDIVASFEKQKADLVLQNKELTAQLRTLSTQCAQALNAQGQ
jgi:hypothetical protein